MSQGDIDLNKNKGGKEQINKAKDPKENEKNKAPVTNNKAKKW